MKIRPQLRYETATFVLVLLLALAVCPLAIANRVVATGARDVTSAFGSLLTQAQGAVVGVGRKNIPGFLQERETGRAVANHGLSAGRLSAQKIAAPDENAVLQDEQTSSAIVQGLLLDARTRQPIAGTRVSLERGRISGDLSPRGKESSASALTDERGRFRFERIESGVYRLVASKQGYFTSPLHIVELEPGKTTNREILLDPLAKLSGRVLDESNRPLKGAKVGLLSDFERSSIALGQLLSEQGASALITTTERQGEFDLFVPAEEEGVTLVALAPGYAPSRSGPISVQAGRARPGITLRLSRGLEAQGRVVGGDGTPIRGATILAHNLELGKVGLGLDGVEPRATSGADGRFVLRGLEKGTYKLKASRGGHAACTVPDVEIQPQKANQLPDIVLAPEAEIIGRVVNTEGRPIPGAKISGVLGEENGSEAISNNDGSFVLSGFPPGASVTLSATAAGYSEASKAVSAPNRDVVLFLPQHGVLRGRVEDAETLTPIKEFQIVGAERKSFYSEDGTFELKGLPPGRRTFAAQAPGYQTAELADIVIRVGEPTEVVVFSLTKGVELSGRVVDAETNTGLPNITVGYLLTTQAERHTRNLRFFSNEQLTDSDGNFKFDGLPRSKVTIIAMSPLHAETRRIVAAGEESFVEIKLPNGGFVSGRVVGLGATTFLPGAQVTLWSATSESEATIPVDQVGAFSFSRLAAGRYRLIADTNLGQTKPQEFVLQENERITGLVLVVESGAMIRGKVTGFRPDELPVAEIVVQGRGGFVSTASTTPDGAYAVYGVPEGRVEVIAQINLERSLSKSIEIPQGVQEISLNIEFPRAARLSGRVTRGGQPVAYRTVNAFPRNPESVVATGKTDQNGMYNIDGLSEGDYVVSLSGEGAKSLRISGETVLDIELPAPSPGKQD